MKNFLKLTHFELQRFSKILLAMIVLVAAIQIAGAIVQATKYMNKANEMKIDYGLSDEEIIQELGLFSFGRVMNSSWVNGPVYFGVAAVLFYIFLIWYRDWLGKNTFIYRLLMLPTARINLFLAKLAMILIMTLSFVAAELTILPLAKRIAEAIMAEPYYIDMSIRASFREMINMNMLYPQTFTEFFINYYSGIALVSAVFTAILFERCFRLKGILFGAVFVAVMIAIFISPLLLDGFVLENFFFTHELLALLILANTIVLAISLTVGSYLLNRKVRI